MSNAEAIQKLQHASEYIFAAHIAGGSKRRRRAELWRAMAMLHECRNRVEVDARCNGAVLSQRGSILHPALVCRPMA
ncbi:MAG: hypothetical protein JOZ10_17340 [Acidobacteria bacterium]|nr:hypothetical protein [Acidobacteriota bacterium]MBV9146266.1 hypothetical protein [Acidobacteriota bacterium]MBV9435395.1 hypothetical protein [Acidobacteriota bacterium]